MMNKLEGEASQLRIQIRDYKDGDWEAIWPIFQDIIRAGETFPYDPNWTSQQARAVWLAPPPSHILIAHARARLLGTATLGRNRPGPGAHVATASFMVAANARGKGVGRALCLAALAWARGQGYAMMQFNAVVETNEVAVRLYQELGFQIAGTVPEAFDHPRLGRVGLHIMYQRLQEGK